MIGDFEPEGARVEIERPGLIEKRGSSSGRALPSVQLLQIGDDGGAKLPAWACR